MPSSTWNIHLEVIGLRFRFTKDGRKVLADIVNKASISGIQLRREPKNEYDENAIAVDLPKRLLGGKQLGYIRRDTAELLAPKLDSGSIIFKRAVLLSLDQKDDWNTGELVITFQDAAKKPASKRKVRT